MTTSITKWYMELPVVTRVYLTLAVSTTILCYYKIWGIDPLHLYLDYTGVWYKGQWWRLITTFLFFADASNNAEIDFLFHMFFLVRYSRMLEEGTFYGSSADFLWMLTFGGSILLGLVPFFRIPFLSHSLTFMMVYVWGRKNEGLRMSFLGLFNFRAPYLPWVLLAFSFLLQMPIVVDLLGIFVGHVYYFFQDVAPNQPGGLLKGRRILATPYVFKWLMSEQERFRWRLARGRGVQAGGDAAEAPAANNDRDDGQVHQHQD